LLTKTGNVGAVRLERIWRETFPGVNETWRVFKSALDENCGRGSCVAPGDQGRGFKWCVS